MADAAETPTPTPSEPQATPAQATEAAAPETATESPFPETILRKRPDLAAKYGKRKSTVQKVRMPPDPSEAAKADDDAASTETAEGDGGTTPPDEPATEAKSDEPEAQPSKVDRAIDELRAWLSESPEEAADFVRRLAKQKNLAGPFIELKKRTAQIKKRERTIEQREQALAASQREIAEAVEAFKKDPKAFAKRNGFDFREWLREQVEEENLSPEAKRIRELEAKQRESDAKQRELEAWKAEVAEREQQLRAAEADRGALGKLEGYLSAPDEQQAFPHVFAAYDDTRQLANGVWNAVKAHYLETGIELDWRKILRQEDDRLREIHERLSRRKDSRASNGSSERANGSLKTAKPAGKNEPTSLSNADAAERVSDARPPRNRAEHLRNVLARHGLR